MRGGRWTSQSERGSSFLLRVMIWLTLHLGRTMREVLLVPITAWFFGSSPRARAASREFLTRARDRPATTRDVFLQVRGGTVGTGPDSDTNQNPAMQNQNVPLFKFNVPNIQIFPGLSR